MVVIHEDMSLVSESLNGDHEAFAALIREHQRMIHSLCYRMTGSMADAEDLAQESFIQAYQRLADYHGDARFSSWLYRIAINQCLNWQKREERRERLHHDWSQQERGPAGEWLERAQQVQEALLQLHPKQRAAVILTSYDGFTHAEAARALGCSETTVSWRLFAARRKLKRLLRHMLAKGTGL